MHFPVFMLEQQDTKRQASADASLPMPGRSELDQKMVGSSVFKFGLSRGVHHLLARRAASAKTGEEATLPSSRVRANKVHSIQGPSKVRALAG